METKEAIRIALQSLWANKLRSVLTLLGVVIAADRWRLGQLGPGDAVRFRPVALSDARRARDALTRWADRAIQGHYPTVPG